MSRLEPVHSTLYIQQALFANEIRRWLGAAGWTGERVDAPGGLGFTVELGHVGPPATGLGGVLEQLSATSDELAALARLCAGPSFGPVLGLAERLAATLGVHVLAVVSARAHGDDTHGWQVLVTWYRRNIAGFTVIGPARQWTLRPDRGFVTVAAAPVEARIAAFLAEAGEDDVADLPEPVGYVERVRARLLLLGGLLAVIGPAWIGTELGRRFEHPDLGGFIGFSATATSAIAWLTLRSRSSARRLAVPAATTATGLVLLGVARLLAPSDAAAGAGMLGVACIGAGGVWALTRA